MKRKSLFFIYQSKNANRWFLCLILAIGVLATSCHDNRGLVVGKIQKASKLATAEFTIDKLVYGVKHKKLFWVVNLNDARFIAHSRAVIKAGVDLQKLKEQDVSIQGHKISLVLPAVEIINFSYPADSFRMDDLLSNNAFMNKISLSDQETYFQDAETDIRNSLKYMDIVKTTQRKTILMLQNMIKPLGYNEIYIDFHEGELISEINEEALQ